MYRELFLCKDKTGTGVTGRTSVEDSDKFIVQLKTATAAFTAQLQGSVTGEADTWKDIGTAFTQADKAAYYASIEAWRFIRLNITVNAGELTMVAGCK